MRRITKRIMAIVLAVLLFAGMTTGVMAAGEIYATTGTQIVYRPSSNGYGNVSIALAESPENFTIKRTSIKITKGKTGAKLAYLDKNQYNRDDEDEYLGWEDSTGSEQWETYRYHSTNYSYSAGLAVNRAGTATVKYKIDGVAYSTKVKVLNYKNPVSKITLSGVKGGKNFASLTKKDSFIKDMTLKTKVANATLKVAAAKGWKVSNLSIGEYDKKGNIVNSRSVYCSDGLGAMQLSCGALLPGHRYHVSASFVNASNGAYMSLGYWINF